MVKKNHNLVCLWSGPYCKNVIRYSVLYFLALLFEDLFFSLELLCRPTIAAKEKEQSLSFYVASSAR
jgi:hypothetical protein